MSFFYEILNDGTAYRRKELRVKRLILTIAAALFVLIIPDAAKQPQGAYH